MRGDTFFIFDIFKTIRSYELQLHMHSARMLKRSFLGPKSEKYIAGRGLSPPKEQTTTSNSDFDLRAPASADYFSHRSQESRAARVPTLIITKYPSETTLTSSNSLNSVKVITNVRGRRSY